MNGNKKKRIIPSRHVEEKKIIEETKKAEEMIKER